MSSLPRVVLLAGGGGGARLARGFTGLLQQVAPLVVTNPGDDFEHLGLLVCPDTDSVLYAVSDEIDPTRGWGRCDESWGVLEEIKRLGGPGWFSLGDRDIALHLMRRAGLAAGKTLTEVTHDLLARLGVEGLPVIPASDQSVQTVVHSTDGVMAFQEYFVTRGCAPQIKELEYRGAENARPNGALLSFMAAGCDCVILGPSNPYLSLAPILSISGMVEALSQVGVVAAVSPIVGGDAIKGPLAKIMGEKGLQPTAASWANEMKKMYPNLINLWVLDVADAECAEQMRAGGDTVLVYETVMTNSKHKEALAQRIVTEALRRD
jgi:LPPG:FO 2-phospho-L-lactate transferase